MSEVEQEKERRHDHDHDHDHDRGPHREAHGPVVATLRERAGETGEERTEQVVLLTPAARERLLVMWIRWQDFAALELQTRRECERAFDHVLAALGLPGPASDWEIDLGEGKLRRRSTARQPAAPQHEHHR